MTNETREMLNKCFSDPTLRAAAIARVEAAMSRYHAKRAAVLLIERQARKSTERK